MARPDKATELKKGLKEKDRQIKGKDRKTREAAEGPKNRGGK